MARAASKAKDKSNDGKACARKRGPVAVFLRGTMLVLDVIAVAALILTAYAGHVSPMSHNALWGILPLAFPFCLLAVALLFALHLFWLRAGAVVTGIGMLVCAGPSLDYCPFNIVPVKVPDNTESFTLLSYNCHQFLPPHAKSNPEGARNGVVDHILATDADIVCLQEATFLCGVFPGYLTAEQIQSIHDAYPHVFISSEELAVLSKFPLEPIHLDSGNKEMRGGLVSCYRVTLPSGRLITLFDVHLQSNNLNRDTDNKLSDDENARLDGIDNPLLRKVGYAAGRRARQAQQLLRYVRLYGGPNVIMTGDFNDVPGCYTLRTLADAGFHSVYPEVGLGPMYTFNDYRLYFRLDHTLYRGDLRPVWMSKGTTKASDHYPLTTKFYIPLAD